MNQTEKEIEIFFQLYKEYKSFIGTNGIKRIKAVKWAAANLIKAKQLIYEYSEEDFLLQKVGWSTFIGMGLYAGFLHAIHGITQTNNQTKSLHFKTDITAIINDIITYTNIGYFISFNNEIVKSDDYKYARIDGGGNVFIYPIDAEELFTEIEESMYADTK